MGNLISTDLDNLIETISTDAEGEQEQIWAFRQALEDELRLPAKTTVIGQLVTLLEIDYRGNQRLGLIATIRTKDGTKYEVAMADVATLGDVRGGLYQAAYQKWLGLEPFPPMVDSPSSFS